MPVTGMTDAAAAVRKSTKCSMAIPCDNHGCYWEDPNDLYPFGCWHCYCPKGKIWRCTKCGQKSSGSACSNGKLELVCGKTNVVTAVISIEKTTDDWCTQLELRANVEENGILLSDTPYVWNGAAGTENVFTVTENGTYTFELQADENSDTAAARIGIKVSNVDTTGPVLTQYSQEPASGWTKEPAKLILSEMLDLQPDGTAGCGLAEMPVSFNGGEWGNQTVFVCEDSGVYPVLLTDKLGNVTETTASVTNIDITGPTVSFLWDETPNLTEVTVQVIAADTQKDGSEGCGLAALPYSYDNGQTWTDVDSFWVEENGSYPVLVKDKLGNITEQTAEVTNLDKTGPVVSLEMSPEEWDGKEIVTITVEAIDEGSGLSDAPYSWDGGVTYTDQTVLEVQEEGTYTVLVKDNNGNITECSVTVEKKKQEQPSGENGSGNGSGSGSDSGSGDGAEGGGDYDGSGSDDRNDSQDNGSGQDSTDTVQPETETETLTEMKEETPAGTHIPETEDNTSKKEKDSPKKDDTKKLQSGSASEEDHRQEDDLTDKNMLNDFGQGDAETEFREIEQDEPQSLAEEIELEEIVVKEEERKASGRSAFLQVMQKQPVKTAAVAVSGALLCSVLALLCFLLLMGVRVYTEDENGRYRLLGMRICRRQEEDLYVLLPVKMTEKSETDRYRLCPGWLFAFLNKEETMIIESAQNQSRISVKVSGKMEFRL